MVIERRDVVGGLCVGEEFYPGYRSPGILHDTSGVRPGVVDRLRLAEHGLEFDKNPGAVFLAERDGEGLLLSDDSAATAGEIERHSKRDAVRYHDYRRFIERVRSVVEPVLNEVPSDIYELPAGAMVEPARQGLAPRTSRRPLPFGASLGEGFGPSI